MLSHLLTRISSSIDQCERWEIGYDPVSVRDLMLNSPWVPIVACLLYGLFIVAGQAYFSTRPPWNLRRLLAVWNLALSVFSFVGLVRVLPAILHMWATYTRKENFCMDPESSFGSGSTGLWVQLFILSKFPYVDQKSTVSCLLPSFVSLLLDSPTSCKPLQGAVRYILHRGSQEAAHFPPLVRNATVGQLTGKRGRVN
jgi:GNS1/SUR4 family